MKGQAKMGLAASQARLLSITSRLADNELRSQSINNAKMRLASESSIASENYINALNDANMIFSNYASDGTAMSQALTYNSLMSYSSYNNQYGLVNAAGQLLVDEEEAQLFAEANGNINEYLKAHGLEYDTTYFDKGTDGKSVKVENEDYPKEFRNIDATTLREWYENYPSLVNSVEYADYKQYFSQYLSDASSYKGALNYMFDNYAEHVKANADGTSIQFKLNNYCKQLLFADTSISDVEALNNPTYRTFYHNIMMQEDNQTYKHIDGNDFYGDMSGDINNTGVIKWYLNWDYRNRESADSVEDSRDYLVFDISENTVDNKTEYSCSVYSSYDLEHDEADSAYYTVTGSTPAEAYKNAVTGSDIINIKAPDGKSNIVVKDNNDIEKIKVGIRYDDIFETITNIVKDSAKEDDTVMTRFGNIVIEDYYGSKNLGITYTDELGNTGKTYENCIKNYVKAAMNYFGFIEGKSAADTDNPTKNDLSQCSLYKLFADIDIQATYDDLTDLDSLLKLINQLNTDSKDDNNVDMSGEFKNIVKASIVDTMIDNYGEPKYAWVDRNDTTNSGNADAKAQWYTNLFNRMQKGYKILEKGLAASSDWLEYALESGIVTMEQADKNQKWNSIDYTTCTNITQETNTDALVAKAEAEYNKAMREIETKDKAYDMELKNIDTEHTSLQTEYDSIKKAMQGNIERTLKFDQSS